MRISDMISRRMAGSILLSLLLVVLVSGLSSAQSISNVDWLQGYVSATGKGYAKKTGTPMDIDNAVDAAKVVAQTDLLEVIKGVMVDSQTAVSDLMIEKTETSVRVQGVLHNAVIVGEPQIKESDGFVSATVEMRVCLYNNGFGCHSEKPLTNVLPKLSINKNKSNDTCSLLPNITSTQEILSKVTYDTRESLKLVVINLKGRPVNTDSRDFAIGFEAVKNQNCSVYSPEKVDPIVRRDRGTAELFIHVNDANAKYGTNVLVIPAKSINSQNYITIDKKDAYLISLVNEQAKNLLFKNALIGIAVQE